MIALFIRPARLAVAVLVVYWLLLFVATHLPRIPLSIDVPRYFDKVVHFGAYLGLAFLLSTCICRRQRPTPKACLSIIVICAVYGFLDELMQWPIPGRNADVADWFADVSGALMGVAMFCIVQAAFRWLEQAWQRSDASTACDTA